MPIQAVQQIRRMRGGAQSHLMLGSDGHAWIVKFQNNPQHLRVLANELVATRLAAAIGLTVPPCDVIDVSAWLIANTTELAVRTGPATEPCRPGLQFGSQLVGGLLPGCVADYLPEEHLAQVRNLREFPGALALDKWTCNANGRQALFHRKARERRYSAAFIDQGFCFNAGEWRFVDAPLRGVYLRNTVYREVTGWESFEPWLTRIEQFDAAKAWAIAETVPPEWYGGRVDDLERLIEKLLERRMQVRALITSFQESSRHPFPNWDRPASAEHDRLFDLPAWPDPVPGRPM
jgi:hypothetical protein